MRNNDVLYKRIMNSVANELKKAISESTLNESRTPNSDIEHYVKSWLKYPQNPQEMEKVINAIINGMRGAYAYREDEGYMDQNSREYNMATYSLKKVITNFE